MSWLVSGLGALALGLGGLLALLLADMARITRELAYINTHDTNALPSSHTALPATRRLVGAISASLRAEQDAKLARTQAEAQVHQMLLNLTHDIKTPLTVATGYVQLLKRDPQAPAAAPLARIAHNLQAVNYYLRYLMDFNLLQEKSARLTLTPVSVGTFVRSELLSFYPELSASGITVTPELDAAIRWETDETLLARIIQNLVGNWLKYAHESAAVRLAPVDDAHFALIFTNQTATPVANVDALADRFVTTDTSRSTDSVGLGLSIVQSLTTTLGGRMTLSAEGTTFTVTLQFRTVPPAAG